MDNLFETHGAFSWTELSTTDVDGAVKFYGKLLNWDIKKYSDSQQPNLNYHVVNINGHGVGGIMKMPPNTPEGVPPMWSSYITVDNVDDVAKKAKDLGGKVILPLTDIQDVGRFCFIQDPQGAIFGVITYNKK